MKLGIAAAVTVFVLAATPALANGPAKIQVTGAWARSTGGMTQSGAAYLTLVNRGPTDDRLVSVATPAAKRADLHKMSMDSHNVMHMRRVDAIALPAGKTVALAPRGYHVMLMQLRAPLKVGDKFPLTLHFAKSGETTVEVSVMPMGSPGPGAGHTGGMGGMQGGTMHGMGHGQ